MMKSWVSCPIECSIHPQLCLFASYKWPLSGSLFLFPVNQKLDLRLYQIQARIFHRWLNVLMLCQEAWWQVVYLCDACDLGLDSGHQMLHYKASSLRLGRGGYRAVYSKSPAKCSHSILVLIWTSSLSLSLSTHHSCRSGRGPLLPLRCDRKCLWGWRGAGAEGAAGRLWVWESEASVEQGGLFERVAGDIHWAGAWLKGWLKAIFPPCPAPGCPAYLQPPRHECGGSTEAEDAVSGGSPFLPAQRELGGSHRPDCPGAGTPCPSYMFLTHMVQSFSWTAPALPTHQAPALSSYFLAKLLVSTLVCSWSCPLAHVPWVTQRGQNLNWFQEALSCSPSYVQLLPLILDANLTGVRAAWPCPLIQPLWTHRYIGWC